MVLRTFPSPELLKEFDETLRRWGQGSVWLQLTDAQLLALGPRSQPA